MSTTGHLERSQLFLVRLWPEEGCDGATEWHGKLQHMLTGEARTFIGGPQLLDLLLAMLPPAHAEGTRTGDPADPRGAT